MSQDSPLGGGARIYPLLASPQQGCAAWGVNSPPFCWLIDVQKHSAPSTGEHRTGHKKKGVIELLPEDCYSQRAPGHRDSPEEEKVSGKVSNTLHCSNCALEEELSWKLALSLCKAHHFVFLDAFPRELTLHSNGHRKDFWQFVL